MSSSLTSILNLPPGVCHTVTMSPRPPTDSLECLGPELEAQADFQIKKKNFFFFVSFGGLGVSICEKGEVSGFQGFLFANFFFSYTNFARLTVHW